MSDQIPSPKQQGGIAARAGLLAPIIGIALMIILGITVDVVVGIIVGAIAMIVLVPITIKLLGRRNDSS